jgi:hypothetical protein
LFSGVTEAYTYQFCKVKPEHKVCTWNEWSFGTPLLCFQEWSKPKYCCKYPMPLLSYTYKRRMNSCFFCFCCKHRCNLWCSKLKLCVLDIVFFIFYFLKSNIFLYTSLVLWCSIVWPHIWGILLFYYLEMYQG